MRVNKKKKLLFIIFCLNASILFSDENDLFSKILIDILSVHFETEFIENELIFENITDIEEAWSASFSYCQSEYVIIVDNVNLQIILRDVNNTIIIYKYYNGSSLTFLFNKTWIFSYIHFKNKQSGEPYHYLRGLLNYIIFNPDINDFHIPEEFNIPNTIKIQE